MIVTVEAEAHPPRVRIDTAAVADVYRVEADGSRFRVRGLPDAGVIYDYEAPQEQAVTYDDGLGVSGPVAMPHVGVWLIAPGNPALSTGLILEDGAFTGWTRAADQSVTQVPGRSRGVVVSFARKAAVGKLAVVSLDDVAFAELAACLDVSGPMLLSFSPRVWPAFGVVSWVSIGDVTDEPKRDLTGRQVWVTSFDVVPVDRPDLLRDTSVRVMDLVGTVGDLPGTVGMLGSV